jgi:hypothetical protein
MKSLLIKLSTFLLAITFLSGCKTNNVLDQVNFEVAPNRESLTVTVNFDPSIQADFGGSYLVKNYGSVFVDPYVSKDEPFKVGFNLNTSIFFDNEYMTLTPTSMLPTGTPIPSLIGRVMVSARIPNLNTPNLIPYIYVDIPQVPSDGVWVGTVVLMNFTNQYFPAGLSISENFLKGRNGVPRLTAMVFGPKVDQNNHIIVPGGIAIFANIKALIAEGVLTARSEKSTNPTILFNNTLIRAGNTLF